MFGQNAWPRIGFDLGAASGLLSPFLPAGFYYKTFIGPFRGTGFWMSCERFIRRAAGMGRASREPDPDHYERSNAFCDVLVVGAGPAGLAAAEAAAGAGLDVILAEQDFMLGGSLLAEEDVIDGTPSGDWLSGRTQTLWADPTVRIMPRTTVFGLYDGGVAGLIERPAPSGEEEPHGVRGRFWVVHARRTIIAAGAAERGFAFVNNDLPGVMTASALRTYAGRFGVACGRRVVLATNNDFHLWRRPRPGAFGHAGKPGGFSCRRGVARDSGRIRSGPRIRGFPGRRAAGGPRGRALAVRRERHKENSL